jgi:hypothetical protein
VPDDHAQLPVTLPSLDHLTNAELGALRSKFALAAREARRKANQVIQRTELLKKPWQRTLNVSKNTPLVERQAALEAFEKELLRVPEAFLAHAYANSLVLLDTACREAMRLRSVPLTKKKTVSEPVVLVAQSSSAPPPPATPTGKLPEDDLDDLRALMGLDEPDSP